MCLWLDLCNFNCHFKTEYLCEKSQEDYNWNSFFKLPVTVVSAVWDGKDKSVNEILSGIYFVEYKRNNIQMILKLNIL